MMEGNWHTKENGSRIESKKERFNLPKFDDIYKKSNHDMLELIAMFQEQKGISRWGGEDLTDSDKSQIEREKLMSHLGGMDSIVFLLKERAKDEKDPSLEELDWDLVNKMKVVHDLSEVLFGDMVLKSKQDKIDESKMEELMIQEAERRGIGSWFREVLQKYSQENKDGSRVYPEANFVKTVDEIEGIANMFYARRLDRDKRGYSEHVDFFNTYSADFPQVHELATYMNELKERLNGKKEWAYHVGQDKMNFD